MKITTPAQLEIGMALRDAKGLVCEVFESAGKTLIARTMGGTTYAEADDSLFPAEILRSRTMTEIERAKAVDAMRVWLTGLGTLTLSQVDDMAPKFADAALTAAGIEVRENG